MLATNLPLRCLLGCCAAFALLVQAAPSEAQEFAVGDEPPVRRHAALSVPQSMNAAVAPR